ncbi:MAG: hypothetical protein Q9M91_00450 [Candidatus Dojkabacteria bacterium]|nr:hypothetical protein [Candidatus Dojkabacteria bacterium]
MDEGLDLVEILIQSFYAKDLALISDDVALQNYFDTYGMDGRIEQIFNGDYFHFSEAQNCSLKINKYLRDSVTQNINIDSSGNISKDIEVDWVQDKVYEDELELQYDKTGKFVYRAWVRFLHLMDQRILTQQVIKLLGLITMNHMITLMKL